MDPAHLSVAQLKSELKRTWHRFSAIKEKMAPLLSELRKKLRAPGNRKGEGWAAWIEAGHIGICVRTANRWADEFEGKNLKTKVQRFVPSPKKHDDEDLVPIELVIEDRSRREEFNRAMKTLGARATEIIYDAVLAAVKKPNASEKRAQARRAATGA